MEEKVKQIRALALSLQNDVIGIFRHPAFDVNYVVIAEDEHTFLTFHVGDLFGTSEDLYPKSQYSFKRFPDNKTLSQMLDDVFGFSDWCTANGIS